MIKRKADIGETVVKNLQKGNGDTIFHHFMTKEESYQAGRVFAQVTLNPGCSIGVHEHHGEFEGYYILSGEALVTDNEETAILTPGDYHMCKDGDSHGIACYGDEALQFIALIINVPKG
ncbi:MAG: cupin domain-containing protein [Clostridiales bacterium]|nr:cupin domain-containing protein [Clostridiales bacterium]